MVLMQTSGFATLANVLASLPCAYQIPVLLMVTRARHAGRVQHRPGGGLADHAADAGIAGMEHHVITRLDECGFIVDRTIKQAC